MLGGKSHRQRLCHDPLKPPKVEDVLGQSVVLDDAPKLRLIPVHASSFMSSLRCAGLPLRM